MGHKRHLSPISDRQEDGAPMDFRDAASEICRWRSSS